ncbi:MAG: hypothetical protein ACON4B_04775 [Flavobacteriaceae bacterium]
MKPLDKNIIGIGEVRGFDFTQIQQSNTAYLYEVDTGDSIYYEVFKKTQRPNSKRHCFPTSKAFGRWAWTFGSLENAIEKFNQLSEEND